MKKSKNSLIPAFSMCYFLVSKLLYESKQNIFVLWAKQDIRIGRPWETMIAFHLLTQYKANTDSLLVNIIDILINNENK